MKPGKFIIFEGIDGSGKSTQAQLVAIHLGAWLTHEPCGAHTDEDGRPLAYDAECPHEAALLFAADRRRHQPQLENELANRDVVCDRYSLSMHAYQSASGCDLDWLTALDQDCRVPDLTIYIHVEPAEAMRRCADRPGLNHNAERLAAVGRGYARAIAVGVALGQRIEIVDGHGTLDEVHERVLAVVRSRA